MANILWTGPDGITRSIPLSNTGAPNFIGNPPNQMMIPADPSAPRYMTGNPPMRTGLPAPTHNPRMLPTLRTPPGLPSVIPQGTGFTLGDGGPVESAQRTAAGRNPLQIEYKPTVKGGASVPPSGPTPPMSTFGKAKNIAGKVGGPLSAFGATQALADYAGADLNDVDRSQYGTDMNSLSPGLDLTKNVMAAAFASGKQLKEAAESPNRSNFTRMLANTAGDVLTSPVRLGAGMHNAVDEFGNYLKDNVVTSRGELQSKAQSEQQAILAGLAAQDEADQARIQAFDEVFGGAGGGFGQPQIIGPASSGGGSGFTLPLPPAGPDYSGVQDAIDQTKPKLDEEGLAERKKGAILTGLVGGILKAAINGDPIAESAGLGTLQGFSVAGADRQNAEAAFKEGIEKYWMRTADVRKSQAESDADYAQRVYAVRVQQMKINADAAQARASANGATLRQAGDKFFVEETVNGMRQLRPLDTGIIDRAGAMTKTVTNLLGGAEDAKAKAGAIVAEMISRKDPDYAMPAILISRMKDNGSYIDFATTMGNLDPNWMKSFNSAGTQAVSLGLDETSSKNLANARRDALLLDLLKTSSAAKALAYEATGMTEQKLNEQKKQRELLPKLQ